MDQQLAGTIYTASTWVLPILLAVTLHEAIHGFVAHWCGDDTAWRQGRVSLNPLKHIDPFGTILLPGLLLLAHSPFLFGYAPRAEYHHRERAPPGYAGRVNFTCVAACRDKVLVLVLRCRRYHRSAVRAVSPEFQLYWRADARLGDALDEFRG